jgi:drug/metabolite transporter (DMT)-like permease
MSKRAPWLIPAAVVVVLLVWASAFIAIRTAAHSFTGGPLALIRLLVGTAALGVIALRRPQPLPKGRPLALVVVYGLAWFGGYNVALNTAERHLDPGTSAMLVNIAPLLIGVGAATLLGEGFPRKLAVGLTIAFAGVVVIGAGSIGHHNDLTGVVLAVLAAALYSIGVLSQKVALLDVPVIQATFIGCAVGTIATLPFAPQALHQLAHARPGDLLLVVYLGLFSTALGFLLWAFALRRTPAGSLGSTTLAVPALTVLLSWLFLDQLPTPVAAGGGALCLVGVAISVGLPSRARTEPTQDLDQRLVEPATPASEAAGA